MQKDQREKGGAKEAPASSDHEEEHYGAWEAAVNGTVDLISIHDSDFRIVTANRALALAAGKELRELIGRKCYEVFHGTAEPPAACPHARALRQGCTCTDEFLGALLGTYARVSACPIFDGSGRPVGTVHIVEKGRRREKAQEAPEEEPHGPPDSYAPGGHPPLTLRQKQVLQLLCEGRSAKEVAFRLKISTRTVEFHKRQMIENLGTRTLAGLIRYAITQDIVK